MRSREGSVSQTLSSKEAKLLVLVNNYSKYRVVFQDMSCVITCHSSCTFDYGHHCIVIIKVVRSYRWYFTSIQKIQYHQVHDGDRGTGITPFVLVITYNVKIMPLSIGDSIQSL